MKPWLFGAVFVAACLFRPGSGQHRDKCLNIPEVTPKKYVHLSPTKPVAINLETSGRITHQLSTHIFYIFLKEVMGYAKVNIKYREDDFDIDSAIGQLEEVSKPEPPATINLEVWMRPDYDTSPLVKECGMVAPPGRFGWFVPNEVDAPIRKYYDRRIWSDRIQEVHWSFFADRSLVGPFDMDNATLDSFIEANGYNKQDGRYVCDDSAICRKSMHVPERCLGRQECAVLLAPRYGASAFLVDHIEEMQLFVKILWLGDHLKRAVNELKAARRSTGDGVMFFNWYPSDIVLHEKDFISVTFKNSELYNFTHVERIGYKYDMHRLVKVAWSKVEKIAPPLFNALRGFRFDEAEYRQLLSLYEDDGSKNVSEIACDWLRRNEKAYNKWKWNTESVLSIGGIFPLSDSSYNGTGIVTGAQMAIDAINANRSILPHYKLTLLVTDGKCKADNVMKNFIDFIIEWREVLVGVLGPACSETVEPLAGVSKHYHIMAISYSAEGASFSDRLKYPYFFRTIGENKHYKHVYLYLFKQMGWRRVAALTEDGQRYTEYISLMQDELEKNNISFIANKKFPREREMEGMTRYLEDLKNKRARIIIADIVDQVARNVMCEAYKLKMTSGEGYVWFLPMWLNPTWYDTDKFNSKNEEKVNCTTKEMEKAINGYFSMTHAYFAEDDDLMQENKSVKVWKEQYYRTIVQKRRQASVYSGFAYDAMWTYAFALHSLSITDPEALSNLRSEDTTNKLIGLVEKTDFHGVSGRIKFRGGPSRFSVINIVQWYDGSMNSIGNFYPKLSDNKPEILGGQLKLNVSKIRWFTSNGQKPEDGALPPPTCAIETLARAFNVECQTAMIILNVIVAIVLMIVVIGVCIYMKRKYEKKVRLTTNYMKSFGIPFDIMSNATNLDKWEVSRERVVINRKLGEGAFGTVYGGEANLSDSDQERWTSVAVKTLKLGSTTEEKLDFLSEAEVMKRFDHINIVKLLGVCTKEEPVYTIMEYMLYGDLKTYLLARRGLVNKTTEESEDVSPKKLTSMAMDVARGLSYLAQMKFVHRDIASRNCLVNAQRCVKLGDFGMTRAMFDNDYYKFTRRGMLPVRWMSPESLELGVFHPSSDVWSYGVLLYEIVTFGSFPFQGKSNAQVLEYVKAGHRLDIPRKAKPQLEALMKGCWNRDPKARPTASEIVEYIANSPRLLTPCLDDHPLSSVQTEDDQIEITSDFRKDSTCSAKTSPTRSSNEILLGSPAVYKDSVEEGDCIPMDTCSPKDPLLGEESKEGDDEYVPHMVSNIGDQNV